MKSFALSQPFGESGTIQVHARVHRLDSDTRVGVASGHERMRVRIPILFVRLVQALKILFDE
jgi:hypothetical protein